MMTGSRDVHGLVRIGLHGAVVLMVWWVALAGCKTSSGVDANELAQEISSKLSFELRTEIEVTCPEIAARGVTACKARAATGETFVVEVRTDGRGVPDWETQGIIVGRKLERQIREGYAESFHIRFDSVSCPGFARIRDGAHVKCKATSQGVEVIMEVGFSGGNVDQARPRNGMVLSSAAEKLGQEVLAGRGVTATVDCGPKLRLSVPGAVFPCTATDTSGQTYRLYYKIKDKDGRFELQPI